MYIPNVKHVCDGVYLSGCEASVNARFLELTDIMMVINCSNDQPFVSPRNPNTEYYKIPIEDNLKVREVRKMKHVLPPVVNWIERAVAQDKRVLVHCHAGRQRSATIVAAYLLKKGYVSTVEDAIAHLRTIKSDCFTFRNTQTGRTEICVNFLAALEQYREYLPIQ